MLGPPPIPKAAIFSAVKISYNLPVAGLTFLPRGNDSGAWVYELEAEDGVRYFLKLRKGTNPPSLLIPHYLDELGVEHLVPPLGDPAAARIIHVGKEKFSLSIYRFIDGSDGMEINLAKQQWLDFGATMRRIHEAEIPVGLVQMMERETFVPRWSRAVRQLDLQIKARRTFSDPFENDAAVYWRSRREVIQKLLLRAAAIGRRLAAFSRPMVLCHGDIHPGNVIVDNASRLWIVDWDEVAMAPKERDLVFVVAENEGDARRKVEESWFLQGYGAVDIDQLALIYYRHVLAIGEIGDYGRRMFLIAGVDSETKRKAVEEFKAFFDADGIVTVAQRAGRNLGLS